MRCGATGAQSSTSGLRVEDCVCHLLVYYEGASLRELSICCQTNCQIGELLRARRFYYRENGTCVLGLGFVVVFFLIFVFCVVFFSLRLERVGGGEMESEMGWGPARREEVGVEGLQYFLAYGCAQHSKEKGVFLLHAQEKEMWAGPPCLDVLRAAQ